VAGCHAQAQYVPRSTQDSDALALVREHWPAFRARLEERAGSLPAFVRDDLEALLTCGDFEHGFLVAQCQRCGDSLRVPFACKSRGICPSCMGRRMAETAALLVEHRLPAVPWRQWVLSFPGPLAVRLGYDRALLGRVCQQFAARVMQTLRRLTKRTHGLARSAALHPGVLIVVQRFRNDLGLFVHLHALVTDGCFDASDPDEPRFRAITELSDEHLVHTLQRVHAGIAALEPDHDDGDHEVDAAMAACVQLALPLRAAAPSPAEAASASPSPLLVTAFGMQLHAAVTVDGRDRSRLERLCRYLLRPAFALDAIERTPDGQVRVHFKKPTRAGTTYAQMTPDTFLARLCALVPPPSAHTVRYYGVLAGHHALRSRITPRPDEPPPPKQLALFVPHGPLELPAITSLLESQLRSTAPHRLSWMTLLARVFRIDISVCARCRGPMRVTRAVTTPEQIAAELRGARPPPHPEPPGQLLLFSLG
jgi:hypothetical protein